MIDERQILEVLTRGGEKPGDYFILDGVPCTPSDQFDCMANVIEDDELARACVQYLRERGAREFESMDHMRAYFGKSEQITQESQQATVTDGEDAVAE